MERKSLEACHFITAMCSMGSNEDRSRSNDHRNSWGKKSGFDVRFLEAGCKYKAVREKFRESGQLMSPMILGNTARVLCKTDTDPRGKHGI